MGGCIGIPVQLACSCDETLKSIASCLCGDKNFVLSLQNHVKSLRSDLEAIQARREDLLRRVKVEELKGLKRRAEVRLWLSNVRKIVIQVEVKLKDAEAEIQKRFISGYCAMNYCSSYSYSVEVWSMLGDVQKLYKKSNDFEVVAESYVITKVEGIPIDPMISGTTMVESTWNILMEDKVGCLGLFGIPGVGKTTLLSLINNEFLNRVNDFHVVIRVVVPKDQKISRIQEEIGRRLEIYDEEWTQKSENEKAFDINRALRDQRYALLLDDMLVKVDVRKIGVPPPDSKNRSKIAFTTRLREVCLDMAADDQKEVTRLDDAAAWDLFQDKVGEDLLRSNQDIEAFARIICEKCCGLPVVINAVGQTMALKNTVEEWRDATNSLSAIITKLSSEESSSLAEFSNKEDIIRAILKFSYDNLEDHKVRRCFRYYALFPENYEMRKEELIEYWECERFITRNQGHRVFDKLVGACLLMENEGKVKMHDMIRKTALLDATDIEEPEGSIVVNTDTTLVQLPDDLNWSVLKRVSFIKNQIKEVSSSPSCPNLTTLLLCHQSLENISKDFFLQMPSLLVLDLSFNQRLTHLPANISKLSSLLYLNLSGTNIELLPVGLKELKLLIYLNLEHTSMLKNIVGISSLLKLRVLRLLGSRFCSTINFIEELKNLEEINVLTISLSDVAVLKSFCGFQGLASHTQGLYIKDFKADADGISIAETSTSLQYLEILDSNIKEIKINSIPQSPASVVLFEKLSEVRLCDCSGLKHLTWLLFAPNLVSLHVERAKDIEEILSKVKGEDKVQPDLIPFNKLKSLVFKDLQGLTSIYWSPLPFKCLSKIFIQLCPSLKELPLDYESGKESKLVIDAELEWLENLYWKDDKTRERFC
ncbi:hypothetical protein AALP_AA2G260300 [Arabis alpina]|uniref:Uncharacterized protein n=1 Tax=Arabis alpina TaxID=50452 RepID=A0A087HK12_ARAAL|nr:hypothetical protein AALP_AA2G260300 [Arabis alpina]